METRACHVCKDELPVNMFDKKKRYDGYGKPYYGLEHRCKPCKSNEMSVARKLKTGFASLKPDYCECCGTADSKLMLMLDHDHETNHFRGFVCKPCNTKLATLGDTFKLVMDADCDQIYKNYMKLARLRSGKGVRS